jgi:hypothetical protein
MIGEFFHAPDGPHSLPFCGVAMMMMEPMRIRRVGTREVGGSETRQQVNPGSVMPAASRSPCQIANLKSQF